MVRFLLIQQLNMHPETGIVTHAGLKAASVPPSANGDCHQPATRDHRPLNEEMFPAKSVFRTGFSRVLLVLLISSAALRAEPPAGYMLRWSDEFDGVKLDTTKWKCRTEQNHDATNVPEAVSVRDGLLTITTYTQEGKHFTGMISSQGLFEARYGYWEARIKWGDAPGTWSAFWLYALSMGTLARDATDGGMEMDIVEHRSIDNGGRNIAGAANFTLHWDGYGAEHKVNSRETSDLELDKDFHTYGFEWTEKEYRYFIDGILRWEIKEPISTVPQFLVLSTEIESGAWSGKIPEGGYGDRLHSTTKLFVDYVRYYVKP